MFSARQVTDQSLQLLKGMQQDTADVETQFRESVFSGGDTVVIAVAIIAFGWLAYLAVAKFREVQAGRAEWSELGVLGTAAAAVLVVVSIMIANSAEILGFARDGGLADLTALDTEAKLLQGQTNVSLLNTAEMLVLIVSLTAFGWVSYAAVVKFRECQAGRAEWSELLVLAVAAGAILVMVTLMLSEAGGLITDTSQQ